MVIFNQIQDLGVCGELEITRLDQVFSSAELPQLALASSLSGYSDLDVAAFQLKRINMFEFEIFLTHPPKKHGRGPETLKALIVLLRSFL